MLIGDADPVTVIFRRCGMRQIVALAELKKSPQRQFHCQNSSCGADVYYDPAEFVALINSSKGALGLAISLYPL